MDENGRKKRDAELDAFWDIDALIPPKCAPHDIANTDTAEIVIEPLDREKNADFETKGKIPSADEAPRRRFIPPHSEEDEHRGPLPEVEYEPDHALVRRIRLYRWRSDYRYYESFVRDAERLYSVRGGECPRAPFFSYVPQYSQMSRAQLQWYLHWRDSVRNGVYPDTDYSYVLLYVYEIINLSERLEPKNAQQTLCNLWTHYRGIYRQLDSYLPEWICDHSLIHRLPPPEICMGELLSTAMSHCTLKEFYVPSGGVDGYLRALLVFCSNYDYRKSKFYIGENTELFDRIILGALREVTRLVSDDGKLFVSAGMDDSKLVRDAYTGALCSYRIKRKIEVEYCSFSRTHELRYFITDVVKHTENRLRAALGIRSRLTIYALPVKVRTHLDAYLDNLLPTRTVPHKKEQAPAEYEKLYELPKKEFSLSSAAEIERLSWETTERLIEAFEEEPTSDPTHHEITSLLPISQPEISTSAVSEEERDLREAMQKYLPFLAAAMQNDRTAQIAFAKGMGHPIEVIVDEINNLAVELLGDILLDQTEDGTFIVIEDYREIIEPLY